MNFPIPEQNVAPVTGARSCPVCKLCVARFRWDAKIVGPPSSMRYDMSKVNAPPGKRVIWRAWITIKGKRVYARERGIRAFPILVDD